MRLRQVSTRRFKQSCRVAADQNQGDDTRHRLEAFSDIVIAFTLSQLAFTLQVPRNSHDLITHPIPLLAFLTSFVLIAGMWWLHHQLFLQCFVADTPSVILNFAFLVAIVFMAYSFQLLLRFEDLVALSAYCLSLGSAYLLLAILYAKGLRDPRIALEPESRTEGKGRAFVIGVVGVGLLSVVAVASIAQDISVVTKWFLGITALVFILGVRNAIMTRQRKHAQINR